MNQANLCTPDVLQALPLGDRSLIFCDCEGYEKHLFTPEVVKSLTSHHIIVETHDLYNMEITPHLRTVFADSHDLQVARSIPDIHKVNDWNYPELAGYSRSERLILFAERRQAAMEWFYLRPKNLVIEV